MLEGPVFRQLPDHPRQVEALAAGEHLVAGREVAGVDDPFRLEWASVGVEVCRDGQAVHAAPE